MIAVDLRPEREARVPAGARSRRLRLLPLIGAVVAVLVLGFLVVCRAGLTGVPISYVVVSGHSMEPTLHTGDVVLLARTGSYRRGDVLAYRVPAGSPGAGLLIIHRVIGGDAADGFVMRGDNKRHPDPWRPRPNEVVGREIVSVPKVGLLIADARTPFGEACFAGLLTFLAALGAAPSRARTSARAGTRSVP